MNILWCLILDFWWHFFVSNERRHFIQSGSSRAERKVSGLDPEQLLNASSTFHSSQQNDAYCTKLLLSLRATLRRYPYWFNGHLKLGYMSLQQNEHELAYSSGCGAKNLARTAAQKNDAQLLLGVTFLAAGENQRAENILLPLLSENFANRLSMVRLVETLAAAQMALGLHDKALSTFAAVSPEELGVEGQMALTYLRRGAASKVVETK